LSSKSARAHPQIRNPPPPRLRVAFERNDPAAVQYAGNRLGFSCGVAQSSLTAPFFLGAKKERSPGWRPLCNTVPPLASIPSRGYRLLFSHKSPRRAMGCSPHMATAGGSSFCAPGNPRDYRPYSPDLRLLMRWSIVQSFPQEGNRDGGVWAGGARAAFPSARSSPAAPNGRLWISQCLIMTPAETELCLVALAYGLATACSVVVGYLAWRKFRPHRRRYHYHQHREGDRKGLWGWE
jgi:hypothetical protein